jgi:hypothetical protein
MDEYYGEDAVADLETDTFGTTFKSRLLKLAENGSNTLYRFPSALRDDCLCDPDDAA